MDALVDAFVEKVNQGPRELMAADEVPSSLRVKEYQYPDHPDLPPDYD